MRDIERTTKDLGPNLMSQVVPESESEEEEAHHRVLCVFGTYTISCVFGVAFPLAQFHPRPTRK